MVYWTDRNETSPAIYRSSVSNPARETVISGGLDTPTALAINFTGHHRRVHLLKRCNVTNW